MKGLNEMKKHLILFFALLLSIGAGAQDTRKLKSIGLRTGVNVTFEKLIVLSQFLMMLVIRLV